MVNKFSCKILSLLLASLIIMGMVPVLTPVARALDVTDLAGIIDGWNGGGIGALSASLTGTHEVTVTGTVTGATTPLSLNIDSGATIVWEATLFGTVDGQTANKYLIVLDGDGTFEVAESGSLLCGGSGGYAIYAFDSNITIKVSGGTVSTTAGSAIMAICTRKRTGSSIVGSSIMVDGGTVEAKNAWAINTDGDVMITGGTVSSSEAIYKYGSGSVTVSGANTVVSASDGSAIVTNGGGSVTVTGGTVLSINGHSAIDSTGSVTINDADTLIMGEKGAAISVSTGAPIIINGGTVESNSTQKATISASYDANGNNLVEINGGIVRSTGENGCAIYSPNYWPGRRSIVNITGGTISAVGKAIYAPGASTTVSVSGGTVSAGTGTAIDVIMETTQDIYSGTVRLTGGMVSSATGIAIVAENVHVNEGSAVTVTNSGHNPAFKLINNGRIYVDAGDLTINGDIVEGGYAICADNGAVVTVIGNIIGVIYSGIEAIHGSTVNVTGSIESSDWQGNGINADHGSTVTVTGNVAADSYGIWADGGAMVTVTGNVEANSYGEGVVAGGIATSVIVNGDIRARGNSRGVRAYGSAIVTVNGNITVKEYGACAQDGGEVTINGTIDAGTYIYLYNNANIGNKQTILGIDDESPSAKPGYREYTDGRSTVWVILPPTDAPAYTLTVKPATLTATCAANVVVTAASEEADVDGLTARMTVSGVNYDATITGGSAIIYIPLDANIAQGTYAVELLSGDTVLAQSSIVVIPNPSGIWDATLSVQAGSAYIQFGASIKAKTDAYNLTINGTKVSCQQTGDQMLQVENVDSYLVGGANTFVVGGVKFVDHFPSYSFNFTISYEK